MTKAAFLFIVTISAVFIQSRSPVLKHDKTFLRPPENIKYFTLGYNDMFASVLWLRLLQNFEYCEGGRVSEADYVAPLKTESDRVSGILKRELKPSRCHLGWVYSMLDVISEIQPSFRLVYDPGAVFLSVVVDDREGARRMFDKAVARYPQDGPLNFQAGYHYMWEMQDPARAAQLFEVAARTGGPDWTIALSAALYTQAGQARIAKSMLEDALLKKPSKMAEERIRVRLEQVNQILKENP